MARTASRPQLPGKLNHPREYRAVFTQGTRVGSGAFRIYVHRNVLESARLGLGIAKHQVPTAVARNRLKRLIRESFRAVAVTFEGYDVVVVARRPASVLTNREVRDQLGRGWEKVSAFARGSMGVKKLIGSPTSMRAEQ